MEDAVARYILKLCGKQVDNKLNKIKQARKSTEDAVAENILKLGGKEVWAQLTPPQLKAYCYLGSNTYMLFRIYTYRYSQSSQFIMQLEPT